MPTSEIDVPAFGLDVVGRINASEVEVLLAQRRELARRVLLEATMTQFAAMRGGRFQKFADCITNQDCFDEFLQDPLFLEAYQLAQQEATTIESDDEYNRCLRGSMFQYLAYLMLSSVPDTVVLPEDAAFKIVRALHPDCSVKNFPFGGKGILHKYIPDMLQVDISEEDPSVARVIEISLSPKKPSTRKQLNGFNYFAEELGDMAHPKLSLIRVYPKSGGRVIHEIPNVQRLSMPFRRCEFDEFVHDRIFFGNVDGRKTLAQMRDKYFPL